jgi:hypothetical protein
MVGLLVKGQLKASVLLAHLKKSPSGIEAKDYSGRANPEMS